MIRFQKTINELPIKFPFSVLSKIEKQQTNNLKVFHSLKLLEKYVPRFAIFKIGIPISIILDFFLSGLLIS